MLYQAGSSLELNRRHTLGKKHITIMRNDSVLDVLRPVEAKEFLGDRGVGAEKPFKSEIELLATN